MPLQKYHFKDDHGHPLEKCREYQELLERCAGLERERDDLLFAAANNRAADYHQIKAERDALQAKLADEEKACEQAISERDALEEILSNIAGQFGQEFSSSYGPESIQHDFVDLKENRDIWQGKVEKLELRAREAESKLAAAEAKAEKMTKERDWHKKALNDLCGDWLAKDHRERIGSHIASLLSYTIIVQGLPPKLTNAQALRESVEKWRSARSEVTEEEITTLKSFIAERDVATARAEEAEEALRLARERQGKRLEWIWDGLRAICAMDPNTEAERMQQWASDTLYGAATPAEWEPDVRALRMEEFKKRPPLAGHAPATPQPDLRKRYKQCPFCGSISQEFERKSNGEVKCNNGHWYLPATKGEGEE